MSNAKITYILEKIMNMKYTWTTCVKYVSRLSWITTVIATI